MWRHRTFLLQKKEHSKHHVVGKNRLNQTIKSDVAIISDFSEYTTYENKIHFLMNFSLGDFLIVTKTD